MRYVYVLRWSEKLEDLKKVLKQLWEQYFGKKSILKAFFEKMSLFMILARPASPKSKTAFFDYFLKFKKHESKNMEIDIVRCRNNMIFRLKMILDAIFHILHIRN